MRISVLVAVVAAASLSAPTPMLAQAPQPKVQRPAEAAPLPDARTIIDRHIELIGGRKAILGHSSTKATGTLSMPAQGITASLELFAARPNRVLMRATIPGIGEILEGFDGTIGWSISPISGPALAQGKELEQKRFDADFYGELHDAARYVSIRTVEKTTFDGRPCYKISLVRKGGGEDLEFYDVASGLKAGAIATRETQMGAITATETRGDYKKFGDLLQPVTVRQSGMGVEQVMTFTNYEYDVVTPAMLAPPPSIQALIK